MRKIELTMNEQTKYEMVKQFVDNGERNIKRLSIKLNCSLKTAYNYVAKYKANGKEAFSHGNHKHKPTTTIDESISNKIIEIYTKISIDTNVNFRHFRLILERDYDINVSYTFLHKLLSTNSFYSPKCKKSTRSKRNKLIKQKLNENKKLTKLEEAIVADHLLDSSLAHPRKERSKYFGELLQMDASVHKWFGNQKTYLHAALDDCTGMIVGAYFDYQETLNGYYHITKQFLSKYGIPAQILTDNRTVFNYNKNGKGSLERDTFTQYGFMCHRLGIALQTSSIAQVKGRVERLFQTLQSRLITELSLANIENIADANDFLLSYVDQFNNEFSLPYNNTINAFENQLEGYDLDEYLAVVSHRKVDSGAVIKYQNKYYKFFNDKGVQVFPCYKTDCLVIKKFNGEIVAMLEQNVYHLEEFENHRKDSLFEPEIKKERKVYRPGLNHPYKKKFFDQYIKYYRKELQNNYAYVS